MVANHTVTKPITTEVAPLNKEKGTPILSIKNTKGRNNNPAMAPIVGERRKAITYANINSIIVSY